MYICIYKHFFIFIIIIKKEIINIHILITKQEKTPLQLLN